MSESTNIETSAALARARKIPRTHFYRVVWRWHFYAGLFVVPFMVMLALTGSIYLFKPQLDRLMYRELMYVAPQWRENSATEQVEAVRQAYPDAQVIAFTPNPQMARSSEATIKTADGRDLTVYINPFSKQILGEMDTENNFQALVVRLHGELMIGRVGDSLVELAASWGLVLLVSGLYLWFPRTGSRVWGVLLPRLNRRNKRVFWRDLHAVSGLYGVLVVGFMILTGLPWSGFWGTNFARVWDRYPAQKSASGFKSAVLTGSLNSTTNKTVPWAVEQMPMPQSSVGVGHEHHSPQAALSAGAMPNAAANLDSIITLAKERGMPEGFVVTMPQGEEGVYTISAPLGDPLRQATLHVDQYSGKVLADVRWRDYGLVPKATEMGIALHEGKYFGLANQLLMLFAAMVVVVLAVSGTVMWWQRRPAKTLGAPPKPPNFPLWKGAVAIIVVLGLAFPMVGISLVSVLLLDYLVLSRIQHLKRVFG
ncbi:MAG: PepSY domain-containing protein [Pyrinomonadaceae bacterium]|nr:PepSY domain-containing protein [Pyrinomonadaceae bacterium]